MTTITRTPETIEMNARLQLVRLDDFEFDTPKGRASVRGWGLLIPEMGFVKFKIDDDGLPYTPCGGKKALQSIIDAGGFVDYNDLEFVKPVQSFGERLIDQYHAMKTKHPDAVLLFRVGDFYETFCDDAIAVSDITGIILTKRPNQYRTGTIELAGFPHHALDTYLPQIVRAGRRVAICESIEPPTTFVKRGGK
nr:MAG TPA: DNA mismatch repair protein [Caudoviricetes sp.]